MEDNGRKNNYKKEIVIKKNMSLPRFGSFKSSTNGKYLTYISYYDDLLQYSAPQLVDSHIKFALEPAANGKVGVMNVRCCYNNKYWRSQSSSTLWVVAAASEPNENESDWSCTLFTFATNSSGEYEITHVNRGEPVVVNSDGNHTDCLYIANSNTGRSHAVIDWESLVILPKYIVFKGDNGGYLQGHSQDGHEYLQFSSSDPSAHEVGHEVFQLSDGNVRIKSLYWGKFWKGNPNWIWANSTDTSSNDKSTLFTPVKISDNVIALKNLGNQLYVKRLSIEYKDSCLAAKEQTINKYCELEISEYVSSRTIYNVKFRLQDSRKYGETIEVAATQQATNDTSSDYLTQSLALPYTDEVSNTWSSTLDMKLGFGLEFSGGIPLITSAGISVSGEIFGSYTWGETLTKKTSKESVYESIVPPKTKVKVSLIATKGKCDVPFSYTQRDVYNDGTVKIEERDDGLYTGFNCYSYNYEVEETKI